MSEEDYQPELEEELEDEYEEDEGYSIPKILVAILLIIAVSIIVMIFRGQRKTKNAVDMLKNEKEQVDEELNEMVEKYNLTKGDNDSLSKDLREEQERLIRFKDSVMKLKRK